MLRTILVFAAFLVADFQPTAIADNNDVLGDFPIASLQINVDGSDGNFMVIHSRMSETATAAVFAGVIGAAINSGINASEDSDRAKPFLETAETLELEQILTNSLTETLTKKGVVIASDGEAASHILKVEIKDWGLIKIAFDDNRVSTFMKLQLTMRDGKKLIWDVYQKENGKAARVLSDFTPELFTSEMEALAAKSGKRVAYEIIYR